MKMRKHKSNWHLWTYTSVKDADVKYTDEDLKAKYEELKPMFRQTVESRDIKYVDYKNLAKSSRS